MADVITPSGGTTAQSREMSFVTWSSVFAGAVMAAALSFVLLSFGTSIALSFVSPWPGVSSPGWIITSLAVFWTMAQYIASFMIGGYFAGRTRMPVAGASPDEVEFRDGLHGGLVWALGIIIGALLLFAAAGAATRAGTEVAARAVASASGSQITDPTAYAADVMLRRGAPATGGTAAQAASAEQRAEIGRILTRALASGGLSEGDRSYLAAMVAQQAGLSQQDAERRVTEALNASREAADKARRAGIAVGLVTAISLLVGLGAAWWAAIRGGQHREQAIPARFVFVRRE